MIANIEGVNETVDTDRIDNSLSLDELLTWSIHDVVSLSQERKDKFLKLST